MHKIIHTKVKKTIIAGVMSFATLALLAPALLGLVAYADDDPSVTYSTPLLPNVMEYTVDGDVTLDVNVAAVNALEITLSTSNLVIDLTPGMNTAAFDNDTLNILVGTSNPTGYTLTMAPSYNSTSTTSLTRTESINNVLPTIDTISSTLSPATFASASDTGSINKWGYQLSTTSLNVDKTVYNPVLSSNQVNSSNAAISNDPTSISFGAKASNELPAGDYRVTLQFMAVTNAIPYLQNLTSTECTSTPATYYDARDGQTYTIQRLEDGRCWMMDNLNLGARTLYNDLNSTNTNIASGSTITASTFNGWKKSVGASSYINAEYVPITADNSSTGNDTDPTTGTKYGTLYNYCAASAGTICTDSNSSNASYDLCPAGWRLPTGGANGEFANLYAQTAYNTYEKMHASVANGGFSGTLAGYFDGRAPVNQNLEGSYWTTSVVVGDSRTMYRLFMAPASGIRNGAAQRRAGLSVRCVLKEANRL